MFQIEQIFNLKNIFCRYEIESDENRQSNAIEIGRRFLAIEEEIKAIDDENEKTEPNNINQNNVSSPKNNQTIEKVDERSESDDDLVIDILNDELISQAKQKIHSKRNIHIFSKIILLLSD
jgi:UDP-glucose 6-dehydrogenase